MQVLCWALGFMSYHAASTSWPFWLTFVHCPTCHCHSWVFTRTPARGPTTTSACALQLWRSCSWRPVVCSGRQRRRPAATCSSRSIRPCSRQVDALQPPQLWPQWAPGCCCVTFYICIKPVDQAADSQMLPLRGLLAAVQISAWGKGLCAAAEAYDLIAGKWMSCSPLSRQPQWAAGCSCVDQWCP
jgi:hypothetical protein